MIPRRPVGATGNSVSTICLGAFHPGHTSSASAAVRIVQEAIDAGVTFLDNGWESVFLKTKVCTHGRSATVGLTQLDESLKRLRTDHLHLWPIHECGFPSEEEVTL